MGPRRTDGRGATLNAASYREGRITVDLVSVKRVGIQRKQRKRFQRVIEKKV